MEISEQSKTWLLEAPEPYILYQAQRLLTPKKADPSLLDADPFVQGHLKELKGWKKEILARHDKADLFIHRLSLMADLGVTRKTKTAAPLIDSLVANIASDGSFLINIMVPKAFGGSGEAHKDWIICDFPVVLYALARMTNNDPALKPSMYKLQALCGEKFYPCCGSILKFKGPGPRGGMCPYANLLVARALSCNPATRKSPQARIAANAILEHWDNRKTKKPFLFGMGTDFQKLKLPMLWYNLLHVLSALKDIEGLRKDSRFLEMAELLKGKLDSEGRAKAESVYMAYKKEEWSDKKSFSRLMTIEAHRVLAGINE